MAIGRLSPPLQRNFQRPKRARHQARKSHVQDKWRISGIKMIRLEFIFVYTLCKNTTTQTILNYLTKIIRTQQGRI